MENPYPISQILIVVRKVTTVRFRPAKFSQTGSSAFSKRGLHSVVAFVPAPAQYDTQLSRRFYTEKTVVTG